MGLRFRKSIKIVPGIRVNFGKKSTGVSFGAKGARASFNSKGRVTRSVGIPGTGLYYQQNDKLGSGKPGITTIIGGIFLGLLLIGLLYSCADDIFGWSAKRIISDDITQALCQRLEVRTSSPGASYQIPYTNGRRLTLESIERKQTHLVNGEYYHYVLVACFSSNQPNLQQFLEDHLGSSLFNYSGEPLTETARTWITDESTGETQVVMSAKAGLNKSYEDCAYYALSLKKLAANPEERVIALLYNIYDK